MKQFFQDQMPPTIIHCDDLEKASKKRKVESGFFMKDFSELFKHVGRVPAAGGGNKVAPKGLRPKNKKANTYSF